MKLSTNIANSHLANIISKDPTERKYLAGSKIVLVSPIYTRNDWQKTQNL